MSVDRVPMNLFSLITILSIPPHRRTQVELDIIAKATIGFKFFQDLTERDESQKLHQECCRHLTLSTYHKDQYVCHKGDIANDFYLILKGSVNILDPNPIEDEDDFKRNTMKDPESPKMKSLYHSLTIEIAKEKAVEGIATLYPGGSFGELALLTDRPRYYSVQCPEHTLLLVLNKSDYHSISKAQEKQLNEKLDFLRSLDPFKNWTKIALCKLSYFFRNITFHKNNVIYKEGDFPSDIYFIKEGEFAFTQSFSICAGLKNASEAFGVLKKTKEKIVYRKKQLKVVIKQKGEMFGAEEILSKLNAREFTCTCCSPIGEVFVISDKNFLKKIGQPETMKYFEESSYKFKKWLELRLGILRRTERFKDETSFTPFNRIVLPVRADREMTPVPKIPIVSSYETQTVAFPAIIDKILRRTRNKSHNTVRVTSKIPRSSMFTTELNHAGRHSDIYGKLNRTLIPQSPRKDSLMSPS